MISDVAASQSGLSHSATLGRRGLASSELGSGLAWVSAIVLAATGIVHLRFKPMHAVQDPLCGLFFYVVGGMQLVGALVLLLAWRHRPIVVAAIVASLAVVVMWVLSRTTGAPVGNAAWVPEPLGYADCLASGLELALVVLLLPLASRRGGPARVRRARVASARLWLAVVAVPALVVVPVVAAAPSTHSHGGQITDSKPVGDHGHAPGTPAHSDP